MKAAGSYISLVHGVSQQVPQDRAPGQVSEQINMQPDPVHGLTRRHGSRWVAEKDLGLAVSDLDAITTDTANWRTLEYSNAGTDYVVMMRVGAKPVGSTVPAMLVFNRTTSQFLTYTRNVVDARLDSLESGGVSAAAAVGKYLFMSGNSLVPAYTSTDLWGAAANQAKAVVWVRGGAYSRTFKVTATKTDNTQVSFEYTTPTSSYQGTLDTSGVPVYAADPAGGTSTDTEAAYITAANSYVYTLSWASWNPTTLTAKKGTSAMTNTYPVAPATSTEFSWAGAGATTVLFHSSNVNALDVTVTYTHTKTVTNPNYAKTVSDLTNAYNSAVTQWIGDSAEAIQPQNIAESLKLAAVAAGLSSAVRSNSHVIFDNVKALTVSDGGDNTLIRGVANEVAAIDQVSTIHAVGKVVKVRARNSQEAFYLKATAKDPAVTSGYTEVIWVEGAGTEVAIQSALVYATVVGSAFYIASTAALLTTLTAGPHPDYSVSTAGDADSAPAPFFLGRKITYLGMFQDRLLIGAGSVLMASKTGDYLNFFRSTVLTVPADDPVEMRPTGSYDDELRHSVLYDKDLVIFGAKRQYTVSGRSALTPTSPNMPVMSNHADAADAAPVASGGLIFYAKLGEFSSALYQIQPGLNVESPDSFSASSQLDDYIVGGAIEIVKHAKPSTMFMRTRDRRNSLYVFSYLDAQQGRKQDAWGRWDFSEDLGPIVGLSSTSNGPLVFTIRAAHGTLWLVADMCPMAAVLSSYPYMDSLRTYTQVALGTGSLRTNTPGDWGAAFDTSSEWKLLGSDLADAGELGTTYPSATGLYCGMRYDSSATPTSPFMRDRNNAAITTGRLVVTSVLVSTASSSGFESIISAAGGDVAREYNGRRIGDPNNIIGRTVITDFQQSVVIGRESREYDLTLKSRSWLPLTITALEWVGQWFNRTQRV